LITVEGHHEGAEDDVAAALDDLLGLLAVYQPGSKVTFDLLAPGHPKFQAGPSTLITGGP
jgi:hypothetical protein